MSRPELARPAEGAQEVLARLCQRLDVVAVISGRPVSQLRPLIDVPGLRLIGLYGLPEEGHGRERILAAAEEVGGAAASVRGAWVEDKGMSLAVHYRAAADPAQAEVLLDPALGDVARRHGLTLFRGKMVVEVAAGEVPGKGAVVAGLVREAEVVGCLYAGDDRPDLEAFTELDRLARTGVVTVKVAVRSEETPEELLAAADVVVDRPAGLVRLLSHL